MLICIDNILNPDTLAQIQELLHRAEWIDGRATAGEQSALVKRNHQLPVESEEARDAGQLLLRALTRHPTFISAAIPKSILPPLFNRYGRGQGFGVHVDNAIRAMPDTGERIRTDVSITLFLSDPDSYDGGELVIETQYGSQEIKLPAGHAVLYPATSLHQVLPITRGTRLASFFWLQSMIRSPDRRAMLFDLDQTIQSLTAILGPADPHAVKLTALYHNLLRDWAEP